MAKEYVYYLFDFDLTLADSSRGIVMCFTHVLQRHGYNDVTELQIKRTIGKTLEDSFAILTGITDPAQLADLKQEYTKEADIYMNDNTVLFPETVSVLTQLKEQGAKLAIISTKYRYRIQAVIDKYFPKDFIDVIIGGEDVKRPKPHPQGVKAALKKLKAQKATALYVGDSTVDAETAWKAGVDFCGVLNGLTTYQELAAYPHRKILNDLTLLPLLLKDVAYIPKQPIPTSVDIRRRAFNIHQIKGNKNKPITPPAEHVCKNCGKVYQGDYCPSCGQSASTKRITLKNSFANFFSSFFSIEKGFLHTIYELWYRPGYMVMDFVRGHRQPYYKPFSLLIVMAALYIVAAHIFDPQSVGKKSDKIETVGKQIDSLFVARKSVINDSLQLSAKDFTNANVNENVNENNNKNEDKDNEEVENPSVNASEWIDKYFGPGTILYSIYDLLKGWFEGNQAFMFIITIPFFIYGTRRAFRHTRVNKQLNAGEYTFIFGYIGSQFIMKDILLVPFYGSNVSTYFVAGSPVFISTVIEFFLLTRNFKQLYQLDWFTTIKCTFKTYCWMALSLVLAIMAVVGIIAIVAGIFTGYNF
ncbi:MAG: HAD-IA family hydrolase [Bacteroidaceae bacterium]|nr:HAD-IA family hydrolase [Bacteroidaceae bacterium]